MSDGWTIVDPPSSSFGLGVGVVVRLEDGCEYLEDGQAWLREALGG